MLSNSKLHAYGSSENDFCSKSRVGVTFHKIEISEKTNVLRANNNNPNINNIQIYDNIVKGEETNEHHGICVIYCTSHQHGWSFHKQLFGDKLQIWDDTPRLGSLFLCFSLTTGWFL